MSLKEQVKAAWLTAVYHDLVTCKLKTQLNEVNSTNSDEFFSPAIRAEIPLDLKRKKKIYSDKYLKQNSNSQTQTNKTSPQGCTAILV